MVALGAALLLAGVLLIIVEAHVVAGGLLGVAGGAAAIAGAVLAVEGAGGSLALAVAVAVLVGLAAGGFLAVAALKVARVRVVRPRSGSEALVGRVGRARSEIAPDGSVMVEGALWRARRAAHEQHALQPGDPVVVERVDGLTLCVRKAEDWEVEPW